MVLLSGWGRYPRIDRGGKCRQKYTGRHGMASVKREILFIGFEGESIDIKACLAEKFSYELLIAG